MKNRLLGAIIGDIAGSSYEMKKGRTKEYNQVRLDRVGNDFTDDTVCTIAITDALLYDMKPFPFMETMVDWCSNYRQRGYGGMFGQWIDGEEHVPYESYGNGSAMRVSPVGFYAYSKGFPDLNAVFKLAEETASITHNHPEGIKGAKAIAGAIYLALQDVDKETICNSMLNVFYPEFENKTLDEIRPDYKFNATCQGSVPHAILCFKESKDYEDCLKLAISLGGDSDTIAAMAGGIAYAHYKVIPEYLLEMADKVLPEEIKEIIEEFDDFCNQH